MSAASEAIHRYWETHDTEATEKKALFLQGLAESGTVIHAAELANINRRTAYYWREIDQEFRAQWDEVLENVTDRVEHSLYRQAVSEKNVVATIFWLKGNRRAKYGERVAVDIDVTQRQVEQRLDEVRSRESSLMTASTKDIINSVLFGPRQEQPIITTDNDNKDHL